MWMPLISFVVGRQKNCYLTALCCGYFHVAAQLLTLNNEDSTILDILQMAKWKQPRSMYLPMMRKLRTSIDLNDRQKVSFEREEMGKSKSMDGGSESVDEMNEFLDHIRHTSLLLNLV